MPVLFNFLKKCLLTGGFSDFRRLWKDVTDSLRESEIDKATEHKRTLEERQRTEERHRTETGTPWKTKYFIKEVCSIYLQTKIHYLLSDNFSLLGFLELSFTHLYF